MELELVQGDITTLETEAIVNAANSSLLGGGGVDGAIHRAGGPEILKECMVIRDRRGGCSVGEAVATTAGRLKAKKVIHTVGPVWKGGNHGEATALRLCYFNCLKLAQQLNLKTIAFPNISTGVFGFPKDKAAHLAIETVRNYNADTLEKVVFVCYDQENYTLYSSGLAPSG